MKVDPSAPTPASPNRCPRCAGEFHCGIKGAGPCACTSVTLDAHLLADLRRQYAGCLCLTCLQTLAAEGAAPPNGQASTTRDPSAR